MALSRNFLKSMNLTEEQVAAIIDAHTETTDGLKAQRDEAKKNLSEVTQALEAAKAAKAEPTPAASNGEEDYEAKYKAEAEAFAKYKADIEHKEAVRAKEAALKAYLTEHGITEKGIGLALRYFDVDGLEVADGKLTDTAKVDEAIAGDLSPLVTTTTTEGAKTPTPQHDGAADPTPIKTKFFI